MLAIRGSVLSPLTQRRWSCWTTTTVFHSANASTTQMTPTTPHRIDVHHHHTPPPYLAAITARNIPGPVRDWTPEHFGAPRRRRRVQTFRNCLEVKV